MKKVIEFNVRKFDTDFKSFGIYFYRDYGLFGVSIDFWNYSLSISQEYKEIDNK